MKPINLQKAWELLETRVKPLEPLNVPLAEAWGCFLAAPVNAAIDLPNFDISGCEGVALHCDDLAGDGPWALPISDRLEAGDPAGGELTPGTAVVVAAGAPLPEGADAVVTAGEAEIGDELAVLHTKPEPGAHCRLKGSETRAGDLIFPAGVSLKPIDIGALAAQGFNEVRVIPRPSIAIVSVGRRVITPGNKLPPGHKFNANGDTLGALLSRDRYPVVRQSSRVIDDDPGVLRDELLRCMKSHSVVITNGGVSRGDGDLVQRAVAELGGRVLFDDVWINPGKPLLIASFDAAAVYSQSSGRRTIWLAALPGSPVSVVVGYYLFVRRLLARLMGSSFKPAKSIAYLADDLSVSGEMTKVIGVRLTQPGRGPVIEPAAGFGRSGAGAVRELDGFLYVDEGDRVLPSGSEVMVDWV